MAEIIFAKNGPTPDTPSGDYAAMAPFWTQVKTILGGTEAMRRAGQIYLPMFPREPKKNYEYRRKNAKFTNIFRDICENLASKPFARPLTLDEKTASPQIKALCDDVDGAGNNLHKFAGETLFKGIANTIDYIFVDFTKVPAGASIADEKRLGARPYFVHIDADRVIAAYTKMVAGREQYVHVRLLDCVVERQGFKEVEKRRVREFDRPEIPGAPGEPPTYGIPVWKLWEEKQDPTTKEFYWEVVESGTLRIGFIPLVPFLTGRRKGASWQLQPSMQDAADLQIVHYQQETNLERVKELSCFPMLAANGIAPPAKDAKGNRAEIALGPSGILYTGMTEGGKFGNYQFIEPNATSLKFLADDLQETGRQLRELGRQPLTAQSGNLTVITTAFAAQKGNSAVQAWALNLKDALELALGYMAAWLTETSKPVVQIYTDFGVEQSDGTSMDRLIKMRANGDLSKEQLLIEAQRRGELSADVDIPTEIEKQANEGPDPLSHADIQPAGPPMRRAA